MEPIPYFSRREILAWLVGNQNRTLGDSADQCRWNAWKNFSMGFFDGDLGFLRDEFWHICKFYGFHPVKDSKGKYRLRNSQIEVGRQS